MTADRPIGLALGGGGALGFAHVPILEAFDELGVRPAVIAGCSMGAIIGAAYAKGESGREIAGFLHGLRQQRGDLLQRLWRSRPRAVRELFGPMRATAGQLVAETVLEAFGERLPKTFAELAIPLRVVATDFYGWHETLFSDGSLREAVAASMALPLVFRPVMIGGRPHIDGGIVNPLPFEHAAVDGGILVAVDVIGGPMGRPGRFPRPVEAMIGSTQLMMRAITAQKMKGAIRPDIVVEPEIARFRPLDFRQIDPILKAGEAQKEDFKRRLGALLSPRVAAG
ncbi:MAG: patatin-like phospholipase family protein [Bauldia sp.]|jgi:NTE family protein|nr:patatin-like phospholipase family protein [Bauldia sp.]